MYKYKYIGNDMSNDKFRGWCAYICYIQCDIRCMCKKEIHTTIHNIININMIMKTEKCYNTNIHKMSKTHQSKL